MIASRRVDRRSGSATIRTGKVHMARSDKLLTLAEAAPIAQCSPATLRRYIHQGKLKATLKGKTWLVTPQNLDKFIQAGHYNPNMKRR